MHEILLEHKRLHCTTTCHFCRSSSYAKRMRCTENKIVIISDRSHHVIKKTYKKKIASKRYAHLYMHSSKKQSISVAKKISFKIKQLQCCIMKLKNSIRNINNKKSFINSKREYFSAICTALSVVTEVLQSACLQLSLDGMDVCQYTLDLLHNYLTTQIFMCVYMYVWM